VTVSDPTVPDMVVNVAVPLANVPVPSEVVPLKKVTVPLGTPAVEVTVAVKTSPAPTEIEADARLSAVTVGIAITVTVTGKLVEAASFESPTYWADKLCAPGPLRTMDNVALTVVPDVATPTAAEPSMLVPSKKITVPIGAAADEVPTTVAVSTVLEPACTVDDETVNEVVEGAAKGDTVTEMAGLVDDASFASPAYCTVRL